MLQPRCYSETNSMLTVLTVSAYIELYSLHRPSAGIGRRIGLKIR